MYELFNKDFNKEKRHDRQRTFFFERHNIKVLRFWNNEVYNSVDFVLQTIKKHL
jgi:very-short-patch-repair endonuclease